MNFGTKALQVLKTVAPTLATAFLGPFAPIANAALGAVLNTTDPKAAEQTLLNATPDQLLALKNADNAFQEQMKQLGISEEALVYQDTANARAREIATHDITPKVLAYLVTAGLFTMLGVLIFHGTPKDGGGEALTLMLGSLATAWAGIMTYYFGSSAGSAAKTDALNRIAVSK
jgi:hypothetical protein